MDPITELAKMLKQRDNKPYLGPLIGKVLSPLPDIKVKLNDAIILTGDHLIIASHIYTHYHYIDPERYLNTGDDVILIPSADHQTYFLVDKAVKP